MSEIFYLDTTPSMPNTWIIRVNHELFHLTSTHGSYNLLCARLMNLSYANYLRLCRDEFHALVVGKNTYYPIAYFTDKNMAQLLCNLLNQRAKYVLFEREHPDFEQHAQAVAESDHAFQQLEADHEKLRDQYLVSVPRSDLSGAAVSDTQ